MNADSKQAKCSRCKRVGLVSRYSERNMFGKLFNRWLCQSCAIARGFVLAYGGN